MKAVASIARICYTFLTNERARANERKRTVTLASDFSIPCGGGDRIPGSQIRATRDYKIILDNGHPRLIISPKGSKRSRKNRDYRN